MKSACFLAVWLTAIAGASAAPLDQQPESGVMVKISSTLPMELEPETLDFLRIEPRSSLLQHDTTSRSPVLIASGFAFPALAGLHCVRLRTRKRRRVRGRSRNRRPMATI